MCSGGESVGENSAPTAAHCPYSRDTPCPPAGVPVLYLRLGGMNRPASARRGRSETLGKEHSPPQSNRWQAAQWLGLAFPQKLRLCGDPKRFYLPGRNESPGSVPSARRGTVRTLGKEHSPRLSPTGGRQPSGRGRASQKAQALRGPQTLYLPGRNEPPGIKVSARRGRSETLGKSTPPASVQQVAGSPVAGGVLFELGHGLLALVGGIGAAGMEPAARGRVHGEGISPSSTMRWRALRPPGRHRHGGEQGLGVGGGGVLFSS